jgi:hypothetical protein
VLLLLGSPIFKNGPADDEDVPPVPMNIELDVEELRAADIFIPVIQYVCYKSQSKLK